MAFKPNYNQKRTERMRAKDLKKQEKLARRQDGAEKPTAPGVLPPPHISDETS